MILIHALHEPEPLFIGPKDSPVKPIRSTPGLLTLESNRFPPKPLLSGLTLLDDKSYDHNPDGPHPGPLVEKSKQHVTY
jgi:hypothetical protein